MAGVGMRWSSAWIVEPRATDTTLVLSAGRDRRVAIDGLTPADLLAVEAWASTGHVAPEPDHRNQAQLVDRLVALGAAIPVVAPGPPVVVAEDRRIATALRTALTAGSSGDLIVAVRTGRDWPDIAAGRLHVGVDLSLHHTVMLGPLVAPGVSSCLSCLDARTAHRWEVPPIPPEPAVQRRLAVVAALVDVHLEAIGAGTSPLVNATITWNLETGATSRQALYKLVGCRRCDRTSGVPPGLVDGRVALPWERSA